MRKIIFILLITLFLTCSTNTNSPYKDYVIKKYPNRFKDPELTESNKDNLVVYLKISEQLKINPDNVPTLIRFIPEPIKISDKYYYFLYDYGKSSKKTGSLIKFQDLVTLKVLKSIKVILPEWAMYFPKIKYLNKEKAFLLYFIDRHVESFCFIDNGLKEYKHYEPLYLYNPPEYIIKELNGKPISDSSHKNYLKKKYPHYFYDKEYYFKNKNNPDFADEIFYYLNPKAVNRKNKEMYYEADKFIFTDINKNKLSFSQVMLKADFNKVYFNDSSFTDLKFNKNFLVLIQFGNGGCAYNFNIKTQQWSIIFRPYYLDQRLLSIKSIDDEKVVIESEEYSEIIYYFKNKNLELIK